MEGTTSNNLINEKPNDDNVVNSSIALSGTNIPMTTQEND